MAFAVSAKSVPGREASEYWHVDMVPWGGGIRNDPRFRMIPVDPTGTYQDYGAVLTTREALEINAPFLTNTLQHWREKAELLQDLLTNKSPGGLVVVSVYEWESGLSD
jgi:hypothetical protein